MAMTTDRDHYLSRTFDPSVVIERDIRLPDGTLIAASGSRMKPLSRHALGRDLLFIDGRREAETAWALGHGRPAKIVLLAGRPLDLPGPTAGPSSSTRAAGSPPGSGCASPRRWSSRPDRSSASPRYRSMSGQNLKPNRRTETMLNMNRATLLGHAGRDPEMHTLQNGAKAASFTLATTERWKGKDGEAAESTQWHRIAAYGAAAEAAGKLVRKGAAVLARVYNLGFDRQRTFHQIGTGGSLLEAPVEMTRLLLGAGERAEVLVDVSDGEDVVLRSYPHDARAVAAGLEDPDDIENEPFPITALAHTHPHQTPVPLELCRCKNDLVLRMTGCE